MADGLYLGRSNDDPRRSRKRLLLGCPSQAVAVQHALAVMNTAGSHSRWLEARQCWAAILCKLAQFRPGAHIRPARCSYTSEGVMVARLGPKPEQPVQALAATYRLSVHWVHPSSCIGLAADYRQPKLTAAVGEGVDEVRQASTLLRLKTCPPALTAALSVTSTPYQALQRAGPSLACARVRLLITCAVAACGLRRVKFTFRVASGAKL